MSRKPQSALTGSHPSVETVEKRELQVSIFVRRMLCYLQTLKVTPKEAKQIFLRGDP